MSKNSKLLSYDKVLLAVFVLILIGHYLEITPHNWDDLFLVFFASVGTLPVILSAIRAVKNRKISIDLLAGIALVFALLNKEWESAVFINLMLTSARIFANYISDQSRLAIKSLLKLRPEKVKIKEGGKVVEKSIAQIKAGDLIVIELGDRIPVDGVVVSGQAIIDQSSLTGESLPVNKDEGSKVFSSTLNVSGSLVVRAERVGKDTTFEKIIRLVDESQKNKIKIQGIADRFTTVYIIFTFTGSLIIYFFTSNLSLVLSVLLVTCADDIAVAVPMAFSAAIGAAAKRGIVIKGGDFLECLAKVNTIVFDKTGTITKGKLRVDKIISFGKVSDEEIAKLAAIADSFSEHPFAKAIINYAEEKNIRFAEPKDFKEFPGKGIVSIFKAKEIVFGKPSFLEENRIKISDSQQRKIEEIKEKEIGSVLCVGYDSELMGCIVFSDEIKPESIKAMQKLRELGIKKLVMLTGDNEKVAKKIATEVNINVYHANLLPEDKVGYLKTYLNDNGKVAMVGDGVNDAAALALADVGISMGAIGSDTAIEASDIALMQSDFRKIPEAIVLSKYTVRVAKQNFYIWGVVNLIGLTLVFLRVIGPEGAAAYNFITDFFPILNSFRVFGYKYKN